MRAWKNKVESSSIKVKYVYTNEKGCLVKEISIDIKHMDVGLNIVL
jgi:hypothetical protein